jgi:hypothetical protein
MWLDFCYQLAYEHVGLVLYVFLFCFLGGFWFCYWARSWSTCTICSTVLDIEIIDSCTDSHIPIKLIFTRFVNKLLLYKTFHKSIDLPLDRIPIYIKLFQTILQWKPTRRLLQTLSFKILLVLARKCQPGFSWEWYNTVVAGSVTFVHEGFIPWSCCWSICF